MNKLKYEVLLLEINKQRKKNEIDFIVLFILVKFSNSLPTETIYILNRLNQSGIRNIF